MNMGVFPSGQWGQTVNLLLSASVVRIHPRPPRTPVSNGYRSFCFIAFTKGKQGWIRTAAALSQKTAQKQPSGLFLAARLAQSTRAHQELRYPMGTGVSILSHLQRGDKGGFEQQQRRPLPAAETGRSCWGCGQQDARAAQGMMQPLGAATLAPYTARLVTSARTHIASVPDL